jgi:putative flippase GtrA
MSATLTDENTGKMAQERSRQTIVGMGLPEPAQSPSGRNFLLTEDEDQSSAPWISRWKRIVQARHDGEASYVGTITSSRLIKFLAVGGIGVIVNLLAMALLIQVGYSRDWRASAIASGVGALHNYLLNNHWTFSDRRRNGRALLNGVFLYVPVAAVGIAVTTLSYTILTQTRFRSHFRPSSFYLLGAQLVSILFGTYLNYTLNKVFTWRLGRDELQ